MKTVFVLHHSYSVGDREEVKLIGVYASQADAEAAVSRLAGQPGFREHTGGFNIDAYEIGLDHWQEGFVSIVTIMIPLLDEDIDVWRPVHAEVLANGRYRIVSQNDDDDEHWATGPSLLTRFWNAMNVFSRARPISLQFRLKAMTPNSALNASIGAGAMRLHVVALEYL